MTTKIKTSETRSILRSQINLNPFNPKRHSDDAVTLQRRNIQKNGYLGGIVWNTASGNLLDGHRRIKALDVINKYDGTPATDYEIKVEVVAFDAKTEKEQLTYMAVANTKPDIDLIAGYINDIDYSEVGLSSKELAEIMALNAPVLEAETIDDFFDVPETTTQYAAQPTTPAAEEIVQSRTAPPDNPVLGEAPMDYEAKKQHMIDVKKAVKEGSIERMRNENAFITVSFSTYEQKETFCELLGIPPTEMFCKGEEVLELIE